MAKKTDAGNQAHADAGRDVAANRVAQNLQLEWLSGLQAGGGEPGAVARKCTDHACGANSR